LPEAGKNLGRAIREFKKAMQGVKEDLERSTRIDP
jgi:Sec-independent protein translocase protein TatA